MLLNALQLFDKNKANIALAMSKVLQENEAVLGKCPADGGDLVIKKSRIGKSFVACANYPKCTVTYSLPQDAKIEPTGKVCEHCHTPIVKVIRRSRGVFEMCLDSKCITKKEWKGSGEWKSKVVTKAVQAVGTGTKAQTVVTKAVQAVEKGAKAQTEHNPIAKEAPITESGAAKQKQSKPKAARRRTKTKTTKTQTKK